MGWSDLFNPDKGTPAMGLAGLLGNMITGKDNPAGIMGLGGGDVGSALTGMSPGMPDAGGAKPPIDQTGLQQLIAMMSPMGGMMR
jgi:hypothetical protein